MRVLYMLNARSTFHLFSIEGEDDERERERERYVDPQLPQVDILHRTTFYFENPDLQWAYFIHQYWILRPNNKFSCHAEILFLYSSVFLMSGPTPYLWSVNANKMPSKAESVSCMNNPALNYSYSCKIPVCLNLLHSHAGEQCPWISSVAYLKGQVALLTVCGETCGLSALESHCASVCFAGQRSIYTSIRKSQSLTGTKEYRGLFWWMWVFTCICTSLFCSRIICTSVWKQTNKANGVYMLIMTCHLKLQSRTSCKSHSNFNVTYAGVF